VPESSPRASFLALQDLILGKWLSQAVSVAARLGIADLLKDGPRDCDELARANQVDETALYRLLRALASAGVFSEVAERRFALTPAAEFLRSDVQGSLRAVAMMAGAEWTWRPWGELYDCVNTG
jgi:predicted transcriptional regulator